MGVYCYIHWKENRYSYLYVSHSKNNHTVTSIIPDILPSQNSFFPDKSYFYIVQSNCQYHIYKNIGVKY